MLCEKCEGKNVIPQGNPHGSECGHSSLRSRVTLCERCSTRRRRCQGCGKAMLTVVKTGQEKQGS